MQDKKLISICIPTFREEKYIVDTIRNLQLQTMWPHCQLIIADYDPDGHGMTWAAIEHARNHLEIGEMGKPFNIEMVSVPKKGIGFARKVAVEASSAPFIATFDADCKFSHSNALEILMQPLLAGECSFCHCANYLNLDDKPHPIPDMLYALRDYFIANAGIPTEPGLCFSRVAYDKVGGWDDVPAGEAPLLGMKILMQLGPEAIRHIDDVFVIVSARRAGGGAWLDLNYNKAFRSGEIHEIK